MRAQAVVYFGCRCLYLQNFTFLRINTARINKKNTLLRTILSPERFVVNYSVSCDDFKIFVLINEALIYIVL
jgi:hypothetical protein